LTDPFKINYDKKEKEKEDPFLNEGLTLLLIIVTLVGITLILNWIAWLFGV
tara:strand:- start:941 stop:1093 length:153 start_codon:yes stop_codon:yes gene_type:complete